MNAATNNRLPWTPLAAKNRVQHETTSNALGALTHAHFSSRSDTRPPQQALRPSPTPAGTATPAHPSIKHCDTHPPQQALRYSPTAANTPTHTHPSRRSDTHQPQQPLHLLPAARLVHRAQKLHTPLHRIACNLHRTAKINIVLTLLAPPGQVRVNPQPVDQVRPLLRGQRRRQRQPVKIHHAVHARGVPTFRQRQTELPEHAREAAVGVRQRQQLLHHAKALASQRQFHEGDGAIQALQPQRVGMRPHMGLHILEQRVHQQPRHFDQRLEERVEHAMVPAADQLPQAPAQGVEALGDDICARGGLASNTDGVHVRFGVRRSAITVHAAHDGFT
eukprot:366235-Chlamydomonas_euryale.AAC.8